MSGAFFSTTLLASRLSPKPSEMDTFVFVTGSIILFALYPEHRANLARHHSSIPNFLVTCGLCYSAYITLHHDIEKIYYFLLLAVLVIVIPFLKLRMSLNKEIIIGPWTIVQVPKVD